MIRVRAVPARLRRLRLLLTRQGVYLPQKAATRSVTKGQAHEDGITKLREDKEGLLKEIQALEDEIGATKKIKEGKGIEIEDLDKEIARLEGVQGLLQMLMARTEAAAARRAD